MAKEITHPIKERLRTKIKSLKDYREAWRNFEKMGKKINQLWKVKKQSFEILREERE